MRTNELTTVTLSRTTTAGAIRCYDLMLIISGSLIIALSAQLSFRLPFSPVPVTGQTFAVLMAGALLGARRGALCILVYLLEGAMGLPVFAGGGAGPAWLLGPTGGYLAGFVIAAWTVGRLCERGWDRNIVTTAAAMILANACIHISGILWLSCFAIMVGSGINIARILTIGTYPFIYGDLVKVSLAAAFLSCIKHRS